MYKIRPYLIVHKDYVSQSAEKIYCCILPQTSFNVSFVIFSSISGQLAVVCCRYHLPSTIYSSPNASMTNLPISSISNALKSLKGRFIPVNSSTGSSTPSTRTMKFPFPGFVLLMSTVAAHPLSERYATILLALLLNMPHLQQYEKECRI